MTRQPATIIFDVNETLSDLGPVADAFESVGAARSLAPLWFASILRDGFALTASGSDALFEAIATNNARDLLSAAAIEGELDEAVISVMNAFSHVPPHADVADGLRALHSAGHRLFTLSNGPARTAERVLREAGALETVDDLLTVEGRTHWKPDRSSYLKAIGRIASDRPVYLAAVHPWDIHGASLAGLSTIWINRSGRRYPPHFQAPTLTTSTICEIATRL